MTAENPYGMHSDDVDAPVEGVYTEQTDELGHTPDVHPGAARRAKGDLDHGLGQSGPDEGPDGLPFGLGSDNTQSEPAVGHHDHIDELAHGLGSGGTDVDPRRVVDEAKEGLPYGLGSENSQDAENAPLDADPDLRRDEYRS